MVADLRRTKWDEFEALDPLLAEPLDLVGARARRRHIVDALARALGVDRRLELAETTETHEFLWGMVEELIAALVAQRVSVTERVHAIVRDVLPSDAGTALSVLLVLGAGDARLAGGAVPDVGRQVRDALRKRTEELVLRLLRRWVRDGYLADVGTQ